MPRTNKPTLRTGGACVANGYASPNERIVEFGDGSGNGGLVSFRLLENGRLTVNLYRLDSNVDVYVAERAEG